jgi:hypothetical protein
MLRQLVAPRSLALWVAFAAAGNREATGQALAAADSAAARPPSPPADSAFADSSAGPRLWRVQAGIRPEAAVADTGQTRPRAVEYSEGYGRRLAIHRIASYAELPLFATEFVLGQKLLSDERNGGTAPGGLKTAHTIVAGGLGALFAVNTVTGVWNLVEARHDPAGRTRRTIHSIGMLLADAGFVWTATLAGDARRSDAAANRHRNAAIIR